MSDLDGTLRAEGDAFAVRFERRYGGSPAEVWSALTEPDRVRRWLAEVVDGRLEPGGEFTFHWVADNETARCRVLVFEPARTLELTWASPGEPESVLRIELAAAGDGTLLTLDHRRLPPGVAPGIGAGWHIHLNALADGQLAEWDQHWSELLNRYTGQLASLR